MLSFIPVLAVHSNYAGSYAVPTKNFDALMSRFKRNFYSFSNSEESETDFTSPDPIPLEMALIRLL